MSRIAILSDIHSNIFALEAVLRLVEKESVDGLAFAGDVVGYGSHPKECLDRVRATDAPCVMGNHDFYVAALRDRAESLEQDPEVLANPVWAGVLHSIRQTQVEDREWLARLPSMVEIPGALMTHAALHDMDNWPYLSSSDEAEPTLKVLGDLGFSLGFFGHTHQVRVFFEGKTHQPPKLVGEGRIHVPEGACCALTVGSVGQPREADRRSSWVLWDSETRLVEIKRNTYDVEKAVAAIRAARLPEHSASRLLAPAGWDPEEDAPAGQKVVGEGGGGMDDV